MISSMKIYATSLFLTLGLANLAGAVTVNCPAGSSVCSLTLVSADWIMATDNSLWVEGANAPAATYKLNLADTNPVFFAMIYNTVKDWKVNNSAKVIRLWYYPTGQNGATYNKIIQVGVQ